MIALGAVRPSACRAAERAPQASPTPVRDIVEASYRRLLQIMGSEASSEKHLLEHWYRDAVTCATTSAAATSADPVSSAASRIGWTRAVNALAIAYPGRLPEAI